ncbi:hypothetical protein HNP55_000712 [Paucibacter oligotrophus]|uniref:Uncharacterized protein n=1 Tax=Roseateles oligotrophus TaxID=1769250 RepID=A0A840LA20_9BURK|nr:hypothetical protein [Roseateles oligotrophus]MBB4842217.1 hypothetical protein [Roseateles oligotrophus]
MKRLQTEIQRLYLTLTEEPARVRAAVLEVATPADWEALGQVWRGVQADLALPAPAIAVSGTDGYQLWFSFAQALPAARALALLEGLRQRYLPALPAKRLKLWPSESPLLPPPRLAQTGQWAAFLAPDLAPVFADEPWLDTPPNEEGQADLLQRLRSIKAEELQEALAQLGQVEPEAAPLAPAASLSSAAAASDPRQFLLRVMNDESLAMSLRIEAAKALL